MSQLSNGDPAAQPPDDRARAGRRRLPLAVALALAFLVPLIGGAAIVGGWAWQRFGSASAAAALLRGEALWVEPQSFDVGPIAVGSEEGLTLRVSNLTGRSIAINGGPGYCSAAGCIMCDLNAYPVEIAPWGTLDLSLTYYVNKPRRQERAFQFEAPLFTSIGRREITIRGTVRDDASSSSESAGARPEVKP